MQITPINAIKANPAFAQRQRVGQDNVYKLYQESPIDNHDALMDRSLLFQRLNYNETQNVIVEPKDRTYDSFTGLRDKNYLLAYLNIAMQNAQRDNKPLSIAMFDMDDFKSVNELLGYEMGDLFIKEISKDIAKIAKENNIDLYRFGGEEFILVFNDEPDSKKIEIAEAIAHKTNTNKVVQSYKDLYMKNAQARLDKSLYSTAKVHKISELRTKIKTIQEVVENLSTQEAKNDPYFMDAINEISSQINVIYRNLIDECLRKEIDDNNINMLQEIKSKLVSDEKLLKSEQRILDEYLFSIYDKAADIYQTKKWIHDFSQNDGFGITGGIVNFEPDSLEYKNPMDIIDKTGRILKKGKNTKKGQVYFENIKH